MRVAVFTMGWSMPSMSTQLPAGTRFTSILYLKHKAGSVKTKWLHSVSVVSLQGRLCQDKVAIQCQGHEGMLCQDKVAIQCQCHVITKHALSRHSGYTVSVSCHHKADYVKTKWLHSVSVVSSQGRLCQDKVTIQCQGHEGMLCQDKVAIQCQCRVITRQTLSRQSGYTVSVSCHHKVCSVKTKWLYSVSVMSSQGMLCQDKVAIQCQCHVITRHALSRHSGYSVSIY